MNASTSAVDLPLHFLIRSEFVQKVEQLVTDGVAHHANNFVYGPENWGLQTYIHAKRARWNVTVGDSPRQHAINLGHVSLLRAFQSRPGDLIVGIRADYRPSILADCHVVQNQMQIDARSFWIPHWPQPGLIPRRSDRNGLQRAAYMGVDYYLQGGEAKWKKRLAEIDVEFECSSQDSWHDYSHVDLVVAVRSFDGYPYPRKPPSKLLNAWIAGAPALVGPESAYRQVGQAGRDFLVAHTMDEAVQLIASLKNDNTAYSRLIEAGHERAKEFTTEKILEHWGTMLETQIRPLWEQTLSSGIRRTTTWFAKHSFETMRATAVQITRRLFGRRPLSR